MIPRFVVVGIGEILWDLFPEGRQMGGAPANFAYHARALGADGQVVSCVGDDESGRDILRRLDTLGLGHATVGLDRDHPTGTVTVELDSKGKPLFTIHENVAWDFIPLTDSMLSLAAQAHAVCFGSLAQRSPVSQHAIRQFLGETRPGCLRVFDVNLRQSYYNRETVDRLLKAAGVLKLNEEELSAIADLLSLHGNEEEILESLAERYELLLIALTKGERGSLLYTPDEYDERPAVPTTVRDTVGAGDAFTAALVMGMLKGHNLTKINDHASRVASYVCSQSGATPPLPQSLME